MIKFLTVCDAFNIPLFFLVDTPGFMVGLEVEREGVIKHASQVLSTLANMTVPKTFIVIRKAFGGGIFVMAGPGFAEHSFVLSKALIGPFGAELMGKPTSLDQQTGYQELEDLNEPKKLVENGYVDEVVDWKDLRSRLVKISTNHKKSTISQAKRITSI